MKKLFVIPCIVLMLIVPTGFKNNANVNDSFNIDNLFDYQKEYYAEDVGACALGNTKTYMDYRATTDQSSAQYWFIKDNMEVDQVTGFLLDKDGFIGAALGSYYGEIGDRYYFTLDSGVVIPIVKVEEKADKDTDETGCYHLVDNSVIEFVIDTDIANSFFGNYGNGLVLQGNYSNYQTFAGSIVKVEKAGDEKRNDYVTFVNVPNLIPKYNIFEYASGY